MPYCMLRRRRPTRTSPPSLSMSSRMAKRAISATGFFGFGTGRGLQQAELAKPGEIYAISIPAGVTSNLFKSGHRIRVEIVQQQLPAL